MSRDKMFNARFGSLSPSIASYPQRTVVGMYKQEQELAKADDAGFILTAADLESGDCILCGEDTAVIAGICGKCFIYE